MSIQSTVWAITGRVKHKSPEQKTVRVRYSAQIQDTSKHNTFSRLRAQRKFKQRERGGGCGRVERVCWRRIIEWGKRFDKLLLFLRSTKHFHVNTCRCFDSAAFRKGRSSASMWNVCLVYWDINFVGICGNLALPVIINGYPFHVFALSNPRREAGGAWCPSPVKNLRAVIWLPSTISIVSCFSV